MYSLGDKVAKTQAVPKDVERVYVQTVDERTGEVGLVPVYVGKRLPWAERYLLMFQDRATALGCDRQMTGERLRVYLVVLGHCDWDNWLYLSHRDLAAEMGLRVTQVSRALRYLVRRGIILRGPRIGRQNSYRLNSHYAYKGKVLHLKRRRVVETKAPRRAPAGC